MSIMTSEASVYTFPTHNRLQTKNIHISLGEIFKESGGLFTLCGDCQMGIINIRLHISQYHIGNPQLAPKLFTSALISPASHGAFWNLKSFLLQVLWRKCPLFIRMIYTVLWSICKLIFSFETTLLYTCILPKKLIDLVKPFTHTFWLETKTIHKNLNIRNNSIFWGHVRFKPHLSSQ